MAIERYTRDELTAYLESLQQQYDRVRLVNPYECRSFSLRRDGTFRYGPYCYGVWNISNRCTNCISLKASESGVEMDKDELKDDVIHHIHSKPIELELDDGTLYRCVVEMISISPKKDDHAESRINPHVTRERFADALTYVLQNMHSGIACFNLSGQCIYANAEVFRLFECNDNLEEFRTFLEGWLKLPAEEAGDVWTQTFRGKDSSRVIEIQRFPLEDTLGKTIGRYYFFFDRTEQQKKLDVEHFQATHDELTQVYNRYGFYGMVREIMQKDADHAYLLVVSNLRDFKLYMELFGMQRGNELLLQIADLIREYCSQKNNCVIGRIQDDRFALLIRKDEFNEDILLRGMDEISHRFTSESFNVHNHVGIYEIDDRNVPIAIMYDRALMATRAIFDQGNNAYSYFSSEMMQNTLHDLSILSEFRSALAQGQFEIYLQPQITCEEELIGAEALYRWNHPEKGIIPPPEFIRVLEDYGQIHLLDAYIWELAVKLLKKWQGTPLEHLFLTVNISVKDFFYLDLYETFTTLVGTYGVPPSKLKLEITESVFMSDSHRTIELITQLQKFGFEVEIDDFGSGFSSLNLLKDFNADVLKIDMGLINEIENHSRSKTILNAVISMSKGLDMPVVSEGVETADQVNYLRNIGCDIFQGFYYCRPIPVSEFEAKYFPSVSFE